MTIYVKILKHTTKSKNMSGENTPELPGCGRENGIGGGPNSVCVIFYLFKKSDKLLTFSHLGVKNIDFIVFYIFC